MKFSLAVLSSLLFLCGCSSLEGLSLLRSQSPEPAAAEEAKAVREVSDLAVPFGMWPTSVEAVGLVTGLKGTGSDPKPSPQRDVLVSEMKSRGVPMPNTILASGRVSLVLVHGVLRPGIKKGDHFDVEVRVPGQSENDQFPRRLSRRVLAQAVGGVAGERRPSFRPQRVRGGPSPKGP